MRSPCWGLILPPVNSTGATKPTVTWRIDPASGIFLWLHHSDNYCQFNSFPYFFTHTQLNFKFSKLQVFNYCSSSLKCTLYKALIIPLSSWTIFFNTSAVWVWVALGACQQKYQVVKKYQYKTLWYVWMVWPTPAGLRRFHSISWLHSRELPWVSFTTTVDKNASLKAELLDSTSVSCYIIHFYHMKYLPNIP